MLAYLFLYWVVLRVLNKEWRRLTSSTYASTSSLEKKKSKSHYTTHYETTISSCSQLCFRHHIFCPSQSNLEYKCENVAVLIWRQALKHWHAAKRGEIILHNDDEHRSKKESAVVYVACCGVHVVLEKKNHNIRTAPPPPPPKGVWREAPTFTA